MLKKERFAPALENMTINPLVEADFLSLMEEKTSDTLQGRVVKGKVIRKDKNFVVVDANLKNEGIIPLSEFELGESAGHPELGDEVDVFVEESENYYGHTVLSREKAVREEAWGPLEQAFNEKRVVKGKIFGRIKGGLAVDIAGVVAFLPGSQIDTKPLKDLSHLLQEEQHFHILKMDKKLENIVVSRRSVIESLKSKAKDKLLSEIKVGMVLDGVVKNITDYGAFIDLNSTDGLVHITDIAWSRIHHPSEVLQIGETIKVMVIGFDPVAKRISLGIKQLDNTPWKEIQEEFAVGKIVTGRITNLEDYGLFVELKNKIDGLVHVSQISWSDKNNVNIKNQFSIGQEVKCKVIGIDQNKYRVSLSIKQCLEKPWQKFIDEHPVGSVVTGIIKSISNFGIFVTLTEDLVGLIHEYDISWQNDGKGLLSQFKKGEKIQCRVIEVNPDKERFRLGIKQMSLELYNGFIEKNPVGSVIECLVENKDDKGGVLVKADHTILVVVDKNEHNAAKIAKISVGEIVKAKVETIDDAKKRVELSLL
ncbi:30S ribosomal protein S1 [Candidatus Sneabacter namystus]|uniref:Small ribosomal subunit protein bS1 n=1 Tax=Candidatus Sneabacter namystus TaxID=2601646 RepID=A0A5C0UJX6_9RICK|nr:30S ribosomal protein S1 [Candidatus Sneabacter namystus]QEK39732.1 30S ribosomal protein S1 [Candidatus Sneabacter namystus]